MACKRKGVASLECESGKATVMENKEPSAPFMENIHLSKGSPRIRVGTEYRWRFQLHTAFRFYGTNPTEAYSVALINLPTLQESRA